MSGLSDTSKIQREDFLDLLNVMCKDEEKISSSGIGGAKKDKECRRKREIRNKRDMKELKMKKKNA